MYELRYNTPQWLKMFTSSFHHLNLNLAFGFGFIVSVLSRLYSQSIVISLRLINTNYTFPPWFKFGASTSAYQIEGAWNVSDKSPSVWDHFVHIKPSLIVDGKDGDVACKSYHNWKRDIEMTTELGLDYYRFSISWSRLLPNGFSNNISEDGKRYYNNLIDGLLEAGVQPMVTLYHWDLPQSLQELGGWINPLVTDWFADYAREVFKLYADRVKVWITLNEPIVVCDIAYTGVMPPGIRETNYSALLCSKHVLIAHAKAWRIYDKHFKPLYNGKLSISHPIVWYSPMTKEDERLANLVLEYRVGRYYHPIYSKKGGWPEVIEEEMEKISLKEGHQRSRLPSFTEQEKQLVKGTYDFCAFNYYTSRLVQQGVTENLTTINFLTAAVEFDAVLTPFPEDSHRYDELATVYPAGLRKILNWLKGSYGLNEFVITENGYASEKTDDEDRMNFIKDHLAQILLAIHEDAINVTGYVYWSLMDNFEWLSGYIPRFGLYYVDFEDPLRKRSPKTSAAYYRNIIRCRSLENCD